MTRTVYPGGLYVSALPTGEMVILYPEKRIQSHLGDITMPPGEIYGPMFLDVSNVAEFKFTGLSHDINGRQWEWSTSRGWQAIPFVTGRTSYDAFGNVRDFLPAGVQFVADDGTPVSRVVTYGPFHGLSEWSETAGLYIGQGHQISGVQIWDGSVLRTLDTGYCVFIRVKRIGENVTISYHREGAAVIVQATLAELRALPIASSDVIVTPPQPEEPKPVEAVKLPQRVQQIVEALYERNLKLAHSNNDDDRRILARMIAEQACFELGDEWGWKSAHGVGISPAKDAIAKRLGPVRLNERQSLLIWDLFNGSTRKPNEYPMSETEHMEQFFIPVEPVNHLAVAPKPQEPPVPVPNPGPIVPNSGTVVVDVNPALAPLKAEIAALKAQIANLKEELEELAVRPAPKTPEVKLPRRVAFRNIKNGKLLCVDFDKGPEGAVFANRDRVGSWETFEFIVVE